MSILIALWMSTAHGGCTPVSWTLTVPAGAVSWTVIRGPDGTEIARLHGQDGGSQDRFGWRPDTDPRPGQLGLRMPALCVPDGTPWTMAHSHPAQVSATSDEPVAARTVAASGLDGALAVQGWRVGPSGAWDGLAWAPANDESDRSEMIVTEVGDWQLTSMGGGAAAVADLRAGDTAATLDHLVPARRTWDPTLRSRARWVLFPLHALLLLVGTIALVRGIRRSPWWLVPGSIGLASALLWPVLKDPAGALLWTGGAVADPRDSAALIAQLADALLHGGDVGFVFRYPEGASVLWGGPSLLGYLPVLPISLTLGPVAAHNLGNILWMSILAIATGLLAKDRGLGPAGITVAAGATLFTPALIDEVDGWSLDRATLALVPLTVLALDRCARQPSPRRVLLAGLVLGGAVYAQVYMGLYLAILAPLWVLPRLKRPHVRRQLIAFTAVGLVAALVATPGLHHLRTATSTDANTADSRPLASVVDNVLQPFPDGDADARINRSRHARRTRDGLEMGDAQARLATAAALSLDGWALMRPQGWVPGGALWWWLVGLSLVVVHRRHRPVRAAWDPAVLLVFGAGPFLVVGGGWTGIPLPHLVPWLAIPGWEQLKNVHRAALMAIPLAALPVAALVDRVAPRRRGPAAVVGAAACTALFVYTHGASLPTVKTRRLQHAGALDDLAGQAVAIFPSGSPTPDAVTEAALVHGLRVVANPPFEARSAGTHPWSEDNPLLNRWTALSGGTRPHRMLHVADFDDALRNLRSHGLDAVVVLPAAIPPALRPPLLADIDALLPRISSDAGAIVWSLNPAEVTGPSRPE